MTMASSASPVAESIAAQIKKQFNIDGGGQRPPAIRDSLRRETLDKTESFNQGYTAQRLRFRDDAEAADIEPARVIGDHAGDAYRELFRDYDAARATQRANNELPGQDNGAPTKPPPSVPGKDIDPETGQPYAVQDIEFPVDDPAPDGSYTDSYASQGLSGANEGLAGVVGLPVDLATGGLNLIPKGING